VEVVIEVLNGSLAGYGHRAGFNRTVVVYDCYVYVGELVAVIKVGAKPIHINVINLH
jgi:hypothetical protein